MLILAEGVWVVHQTARSTLMLAYPRIEIEQPRLIDLGSTIERIHSYIIETLTAMVFDLNQFSSEGFRNLAIAQCFDFTFRQIAEIERDLGLKMPIWYRPIIFQLIDQITCGRRMVDAT